MVLDRQGSYTRPVIGLVRCVCKDETEQTGRSSPIKIRICSLHFFAPIWMAQPIVRNFQRISMADLKPRQPGFFKKGWYKWDGKGKPEEEAFAGHTMGCIRLMVTDNNVEPFHYRNWIRFNLMLHKSANYYAIWQRFLHLNEYLRNFTPDTANATIDAHARGLTEHLVQFLAEWIIMALEPARVITKVWAPDFLFLHDKDFWFKQIWVDLHQTMVLDRQGSYTRPVIGLNALCLQG